MLFMWVMLCYEMLFPNGIVLIVKLRKKVVIAKVNLRCLPYDFYPAAVCYTQVVIINELSGCTRSRSTLMPSYVTALDPSICSL